MGRRALVIGAGIAGAATAYFVARRGRAVTLLEKDRLPGMHSSGRNAAIARTLVGDAALQRLALESLAFYEQPPAGFAADRLLRPVGLCLAATAEHAAALERWAGDALEDPRTVRLDPAELRRRIPPLAEGLEHVLFRPAEGVLDVAGLLHAFLAGAREHGAELRCAIGVERIELRGGRVVGVVTSEGLLEGDPVILAGGGWAAALAERSGLGLPLVPFRRHLLVTAPLAAVAPDWPVVWLAGDEFYFRPESGGLLLSPCDTAPVDPDEGERADPRAAEWVAEKVARWLPALAGAAAAHLWAGMRTFAPDHRFVIGPDPRVEGLDWVAALGGHGMTCAAAVGALAADWAITRRSAHLSAEALLPARLL